MVEGAPFEVSKEVYDRAKANHDYMVDQDTEELFTETVRFGYGLYDCKVHEINGKYICTWMRGSSCD